MAVRKKNDVLLSYVGFVDDPTRIKYGPIIALADKRFRDEMVVDPSLKPETIEKINSTEYEFEKFILFYTGEDTFSCTDAIVKKLREIGKEVIPVNLRIDDPQDYEEICRKTIDEFTKLKKPDKEKYYASITSGTPVMHTCWFYLTMSRHLPLTLLRVREPKKIGNKQNYVEIVEPFVARNLRFDFDVVPKLAVNELSFEKALSEGKVVASGRSMKVIYKKTFKLRRALTRPVAMTVGIRF